MYAFLNDISISPDGVEVVDNWPLINQAIIAANKLADYGIEKMKCPKAFASSPIANSFSLAHYLNVGDGDPKKLLVLNFLVNRVDSNFQSIQAAIDLEYERKLALCDVYCNNKSSLLLSGAYLGHLPSLSFCTHPNFQLDFLECNFVLCYLNENSDEQQINITNIYSEAQLINHRAYLIEVKKAVLFGRNMWDPLKQPIWNNQTSTTLNNLKFPLSVHGLKEKKPELLEVGSIIAELNGWIYDEHVTKLNHNKGQIRLIFRAVNGKRVSYLSVDVENAFGRFELHDQKGRHEKEIDFEFGLETKAADPDGLHDIKVR